MFTGTAIKGLIQIAIFWGVGILVFNIDFGLSPAAAIILSILVIIMSSAFGIMLATLVKTERSAGSIGVARCTNTGTPGGLLVATLHHTEVDAVHSQDNSPWLGNHRL